MAHSDRDGPGRSSTPNTKVHSKAKWVALRVGSRSFHADDTDVQRADRAVLHRQLHGAAADYNSTGDVDTEIAPTRPRNDGWHYCW